MNEIMAVYLPGFLSVYFFSAGTISYIAQYLKPQDYTELDRLRSFVYIIASIAMMALAKI